MDCPRCEGDHAHADCPELDGDVDNMLSELESMRSVTANELTVNDFELGHGFGVDGQMRLTFTVRSEPDPVVFALDEDAVDKLAIDLLNISYTVFGTLYTPTYPEEVEDDD